MSDNNAGYNDSDQDNYYASNNSAQADFGQFQDGRNQPAAQPYNPNPYASQQPAQPAQPFYGQPTYGQPTYGQPDYTQSAQPPIISSRRSPDTSSPHTISHQSTRSRPTIRRPNSSPATGYAQKSKIVAGLLGLFLGGLGVHNFYLGYTGKAVAQLLLTLIGWIILIGPIISGIWALIESVLILCSSYGSNWHRDGRGQELQD